MEMKIKKIKGQNFGGLKEFDYDFFERTQISGSNGLGKTTLMNAFFWVLIDKTADGTSAGSLFRPHGIDGTDVDYIDISVEITFDVDGREIRAKKTQKQNWVKDRTTQESKFKGNVNEFEINDIPKKEKDFKEYMEQFINLEEFVFCSNPKAFLRLDTKKRRERLLGMVGSFTNDDVIATDKNFEFMRNELMDGTIDELISRSKKAISKFKEDLKMIPVRIDEISASKVEVDADAVEKEEADVRFEIEAIEKKLAEVDEKLAEHKSAANSILSLKFRLSDMINKANAMAEHTKNNLFWAKENAEKDVAIKESELNIQESKIDAMVKSIMDFEKTISEIDVAISEEEKRELDPSNNSCPTCGRKYPDAQIKKIEANFNEAKAKKIEEHKKYQVRLRESIKEVGEQIEVANKELESIKKQIEEANEVFSKAFDAYRDFDVSTDVISSVEYKDTEKQIAECEKKMVEIAPIEAEKEAIKTSLLQAKERQAEVFKLKFAIESNADVDARVQELKDTLLQTSQKLANEEQRLDLYEAFSRKKIEMLTDKVNSFFSVIKWQMFKQNINGGYEAVCMPLVDGTNYDTLLNHGNKLLAEIDLCQAFQNANEIKAPIFVDDTESLDSWRVPKLSGQLIAIRRTDEATLTVAEME